MIVWTGCKAIGQELVCGDGRVFVTDGFDNCHGFSFGHGHGHGANVCHDGILHFHLHRGAFVCIILFDVRKLSKSSPYRQEVDVLPMISD